MKMALKSSICGHNENFVENTQKIHFHRLNSDTHIYQIKSQEFIFPSIFNDQGEEDTSISFKPIIVGISVFRQICLKLNSTALYIIPRVPCTAVFLRSRTPGVLNLNIYFLNRSS